MTTNRIPAPVRQRSGAKGGKAARRAAQLRKKEHLLRQGNHASSTLGYPRASLYDYEGSTFEGADSSEAFSVLDPTTPIPEFSFGGDPEHQTPRFTSKTTAYPMYRSSNPACTGDPDQSMHDYAYQSASDLTLEDMLRAHQDDLGET